MRRGPEHPIIRLRLGRRSAGSGEGAFDFLDVVRPERYTYTKESADTWAQRVFDQFRAAVGADRGSQQPVIGEASMLCSHHGWEEPGATTTLAAFPDGGVATYLYEMA
jgi:hypothetical protein